MSPQSAITSESLKAEQHRKMAQSGSDDGEIYRNPLG
jgi:hypothetical protein